jgi:hypothetical protein
MHSNFYEVRISKIVPAVPRSRGDPRARATGGHGSTGGATGAGFGLLYFDWRTAAYLRPPPAAGPWASAPAGIAFAKPDFGYNKR